MDRFLIDQMQFDVALVPEIYPVSVHMSIHESSSSLAGLESYES